MEETELVYVTYISTTPQRIWDAILRPEFTREYWGHENLSDWKPGSSWEHREPHGGKLNIVGKVLEVDPPRRLVLSWAATAQAKDPSSYSRVTFQIEPMEGDMVRLTVTHDGLAPDSDMKRMVGNGWPRVLSSMKSYLETGKGLNIWAKELARS